MKKVLISGGTGFVGRHLTERLVKEGYDVTVVDPKARPGGKPPIAQVEYGMTIENFFSILPGALKGCDHFIHLAANIEDVDARSKAGVSAYRDILTDYVVAQEIEKNPPRINVVWPTSCAVDHPADPYAWVKLTGEKLFGSLRKANVPVVMLRPYSGYGKDQALSYPFPALLKRTKESVGSKKFIEIWGSGEQVRDFIHIDDLVEAFMMAIRGYFPAHLPIDIGTGEGTNFKQLVRMMYQRAASGSFYTSTSPNIITNGYKAEASSRRVANTTLAEMFGFKAKISLDEGIKRCFD